MKDQALRRSIMIVAKANLTRGDQLGNILHRVLMSIVDGAETLDEVFDEPPKGKKK